MSYRMHGIEKCKMLLCSLIGCFVGKLVCVCEREFDVDKSRQLKKPVCIRLAGKIRNEV